MAVMLPPTIALKSVWFDSYLNYCNDSNSEMKGFLRFNGDNVFSSLAKFQVVQARSRRGLVHIRCIHNKRFVRTRFEGDDVLSPEADEPEENQSKWSCTLFEPEAVDGNIKRIRFIHVQTKKYVVAWANAGIRFWRIDRTEEVDLQNAVDFIDLESMVILPKHLAFKGDNDRYLQQAAFNQLRFISADKGIPESGFEVFTNADGKVTIKVFNSLTDNYLRLEGDNIFADGDHNSSTKPPSEFLPVKINASTAALICLTKTDNRFCRRWSTNIDCSLGAPDGSISISNWARFGLEELVISRRIYDIVYDLEQKVIFDETPIVMASETATNGTSADNTVVLKFTYTETKSNTWSSSHSWMVGMSVKASFNIPFIGGTDVTVSGEYSGSYNWGETQTSEQTLETTYTVTVPAHTTVTVSMMATKGKCDVPYSYYSRDVLYNGDTIIYKNDDGLCTCVNAYNFLYKVTSSDSSNLPKFHPVPLSHIQAASTTSPP